MRNLTIRNAAVKPAAVDPIPVVKTHRGTTLATQRNICDFPVPGSPINNKCDSVLTDLDPPANTKATANLTNDNPNS